MSMVHKQKKMAHLFQRKHQRLVRGRVKEVEVDEIVDAERLEEEDDVAQVDPLDLRHGVVLQLIGVGPRGVQPETLSGRDAARPARSLVG